MKKSKISSMQILLSLSALIISDRWPCVSPRTCRKEARELFCGAPAHIKILTSITKFMCFFFLLISLWSVSFACLRDGKFYLLYLLGYCVLKNNSERNERCSKELGFHWWSSGHATPECGALAHGISQAEGIWGMARAGRSVWPSPEAGHKREERLSDPPLKQVKHTLFTSEKRIVLICRDRRTQQNLNTPAETPESPHRAQALGPIRPSHSFPLVARDEDARV